MRIAFTIILNGLHHLKHNDYAEYILKHFDYWVVVEGACGNTGSTSWCNPITTKYQKNGASIDGTIEYLEELSKTHKNLIFTKSTGIWENKDVMVNVAINKVKEITNKCFLWEIDIDEQWTISNIKLAEKMVVNDNIKTASFLCNCFVGSDLVAIGYWGEGKGLPYRRLWNWSGEFFITHEPPLLDCINKEIHILPIRFNHYSYYFEKDVIFKNDFYTDNVCLLKNWKRLQTTKQFPVDISKLLGGDIKNNTKIYKVENDTLVI